MKNIFDVAAKLINAAIDFLRKENWVGAIVIIVLMVAFLTRLDSKEEKAEYAKMYAVCQEEKRVALALSTAREDTLRASFDKFKADILEQYRRDKEANDAIIREMTISRLEQRTYINRVNEEQQKNIQQTKKIESKIDKL